MHEAFGEFMDLFSTGVPIHSDCKFAIDLCKLASEVGILYPFLFHKHFVALQRFSRLLVHANYVIQAP